MTAQEAYVHLQLRHRHACDRLGNRTKTLWSSEDIEATATLLRWAASRSSPPPAEPVRHLNSVA